MEAYVMSQDFDINIFYIELIIPILIILIISMLPLTIKLLVSGKKLKETVGIIKTYFTTTDNIDKYKDSTTYKILVENTSNLLNYINAKDWGMAAHFAEATNRDIANIPKKTDLKNENQTK
jgi:hypothetical protein